jgi:uncharacterized membrane protein
MELLYKIILTLHITAGFTALSTGTWALLVKKGGKAHKIVGNIFFYAMIVVALTAVGIAIPKSQTFLLMIAIFAFFQSYFGYRSTKNRSMKPNIVDWLVLALAAGNSFFMLYSLQIVLIVFGSISTVLTVGQFTIYLKAMRGQELPRQTWLRQHIGMMMGAFIATITAFVLVNLRGFEPSWLPWLAPTAVLVPLIAYYQNKYAPTKKAKVS